MADQSATGSHAACATPVERRFDAFTCAIKQSIDLMPGADRLEPSPPASDAERDGRLAYRTGRFKEALRLVKELEAIGFDHSHKRLLDIACGFGGHVAAFSAIDTYCVGIDFIDHDFSRLRSALRGESGRANAAFALADVNALPFRRQTFDVVFSNKLLEHLTDDQIRVFLRELRHLLTPNGLAIIAVPVAMRGLRSDPHYALPLVSVLPARMKRFVAERLLGRRYPWTVHQTFIHSRQFRRWCNREDLVPQPQLHRTGRKFKLASRLPMSGLVLAILKLLYWDYVILSPRPR